MKINQIFNLKRFINLIKSDLILNYKKYILLTVSLFVAEFVIIFLFMPYLGMFNVNDYIPAFYFSFFILLGYIGMSFPAFSEKKTTGSYLLVPASVLEKYSVQFLRRMIIAPIMFFVVFWIDAQLARLVILYITKEATLSIDVFSYSCLYKKMGYIMWFETFIYEIFILSFFFSVRLFFNKHGLLKSIVLLGVGFLMYLLMILLFTQIFYPEASAYEVNYPHYNITDKIAIPEQYTTILLSVSSLFLLVIGFFKLKEKKL